MKRYFKKIFYILIILSAFILFTNLSLKNYAEAFSYKEQLNSDWTKQGVTDVVNPTKNVVDNIVKIIRVVGTGISIIMISYIGIKYMTGSPNEKADYKKSAIPFITGAVILFAATNLVGIIYKFSGVITS